MNSIFHIDPQARLRSIVSRALGDCSYENSIAEDAGMLRIDARRADGTRVHLRFRGVLDSESTEPPVVGSKMRLLSVSLAEKFSLLRLLRPQLPHHHSTGEVRVRIKAGTALIDVVCQDAEWWEDPPGAPTRAEPN